MPFDASLDGHRIDRLVHVSLVFMIVLLAVMIGWMVYACLRHGRRHAATCDDGNSHRAKILPLGIAGFVLFIVDGNLLMNSTHDMEQIFWNFPRAEAHPEAVRIEVNAHQWAWDARYPGADGKFNTADDIVVLNDLRVPVNVPILFELSSVDVIHSFYLPSFRTKIDVVPGQLSKLWVQAQKTGEYEIGCAQHCGVNHYKMRGLLTVLPHEEFRDWAQEASAQSARAYDLADRTAHWGWDWK